MKPSKLSKPLSVNCPASPPKSILMIKSHSMGVGDLLRSSAAWRALKLKWPGVQLHLLFLSKHAGYPTEGLIREHPLLSSAEFLVIQHGHPGLARSQRPKVPFLELVKSVQEAAKRCGADWIIDFEASGARTSLLSWFGAKAVGAKTLGINQVFGRGLLYTECSESVQVFANHFGYALPLEYTLRDFVVLSRWGIYRDQLPIELSVSKEGALAKQALTLKLQSIPASNAESNLESKALRASQTKELVIGLNIGCGTPDAVYKRPNLEQLALGMRTLSAQYPHKLVLTGAPNERDINQEFIKTYALIQQDDLNEDRGAHIVDYAGMTNLSALTGVIDACDVFISTDSGPYHMAVALKRPTLVWFTYAEHTSFHDEAWCERVIDPTAQEFVAAFKKLLTP